MTTLSQPNPIPPSKTLGALPQIPRDEGGPVFAEPWQAQALALAAKLSELGHFTWKEWAAALERLVTVKGLSDPAAMLARKEAWADAYRHTPHGKPVELISTADASMHNHKNG
jgi:hypothetical protein